MEESGDMEAVLVRERANIQDGVIVHAPGGSRVVIGRGSSLAHGAVAHGPCRVGDDCFIGFNSVVFKASLGEGVIVMHRSLVEGVDVPAGMCVPSMTAVSTDNEVSRLGPLGPEVVEIARRVRDTNVGLTEAAHRPGMEG
jgi:carbonic anhydrase/acetyltransferase-like protein (isoleucine patch superfamily)